MNYIIIIIVGFAGIVLGRKLALQRQGFVTRQSKVKMARKEKILEFLRENDKIQNNDVEKLVGVSNATAERYLDELEGEGKLTQHGKIGTNVFYTLK